MCVCPHLHWDETTPSWLVPSGGCLMCLPMRPHLGGQLRAPAASPAALPRGFATDGSWHLHPLQHQNGWAVVNTVIWRARCWGTSPACSPGDGTHTNSKAPWVEGVPGEVSHRCAVLDGGHGHIRETSRLGELWERGRGSPALCPPASCRPLSCAGGYLEDGDLATGREQGEGNALVVGAEAIALAWRGEAEPPQVGEVGVTVQHPALRVPEARAGPWRRWEMG